ncbi:hypothetical protein [Aequorivita nionensis]|uniref:hypothetical protein n=1 Tax=Aequorivita nionensis TaxID=1287690 RepID=UPI003965C41D
MFAKTNNTVYLNCVSAFPQKDTTHIISDVLQNQYVKQSRFNQDVKQTLFTKPRIKEKSTLEFLEFLASDIYKIKSPIEDLKELNKNLLKLEDNWDGQGAMSISPIVYQKCFDFLNNYYNFIKDTFNIVIALPEISPTPDGNLDILWRNNNSRLLIHINENSAVYYGDQLAGINSIKGQIEIENVQEFLATWMLKLG